MKDKTLAKLQKKMNKSAKAISLCGQTITELQKLQSAVVTGFSEEVMAVVKKSQEAIDLHTSIIAEAEGMKLDG